MDNLKRFFCDHKNRKIMIYPDFTSSGLWCECGVSFANPKENDLNIPEGIIELVQLWSNYWDELCFKDNPIYLDGATEEVIEYHQNKINIMGKELQRVISAYHSCEFIEQNSKILHLD